MLDDKMMVATTAHDAFECDQNSVGQSEIFSENYSNEAEFFKSHRMKDGIKVKNRIGIVGQERRKEVNLISFAFLIKCALVITTSIPLEIIAQSDSTIRITRFGVPAQAQVGDLRQIYCAYKLQGAVLHAMKLFKDDHEFYRFTPRDKKMAFPVPGIQLDLNRSNEREAWLRINKQSSGKYKCQVSIEGTFNSVTQERQLEAYDQFNSQRQSQAVAAAALRNQQQKTSQAAVRMQTLTIQNGTRASAPNSNHHPGNNNPNSHFVIPSMSQFLPSSSSGATGMTEQLFALATILLTCCNLLLSVAGTNLNSSQRR